MIMFSGFTARCKQMIVFHIISALTVRSCDYNDGSSIVVKRKFENEILL